MIINFAPWLNKECRALCPWLCVDIPNAAYKGQKRKKKTIEDFSMRKFANEYITLSAFKRISIYKKQPILHVINRVLNTLAKADKLPLLTRISYKCLPKTIKHCDVYKSTHIDLYHCYVYRILIMHSRSSSTAVLYLMMITHACASTL